MGHIDAYRVPLTLNHILHMLPQRDQRFLPQEKRILMETHTKLASLKPLSTSNPQNPALSRLHFFTRRAGAFSPENTKPMIQKTIPGFIGALF